ncbi:uncharacterized protein LODBEIA_P44500 [Lodderomyces beijingensis]|uniref:t-SNARE coiled-coil homology domain-containing protein n=1 Tax=Lodderomyces beijingensis TaxID=1775926 RepID=A0ABP0ZPY4_9ASCO
MIRDRTKLFLSFRRTLTREPSASRLQNPFSDKIDDAYYQDDDDGDDDDDDDLLNSENDNLILSSRKRQSKLSSTTKSKSNKKSKSQDIEMKPMVPTPFEISRDLDTYLAVISRQTQDLQHLYKQLIICNKSQEKKTMEQQIEESNYQILRQFELCYVAIRKFEYLAQHHVKLRLNYQVQDVDILQNLKRKYASEIQRHLVLFRSLQNNYMNFLRDDDDEFELLIKEKKIGNAAGTTTTTKKIDNDAEEFSKEFLQSTQTQAQLQLNQTSDMAYLDQREKEINKLAHGILEISTIFKEMETLVIDQGTMLDRIDYNLCSTVQDLKSSDKELVKARSYQKRTTKCKIIFFLGLCVFALLMLVLVRPGGGGGGNKTTVIEKPGTGAPSQPESPSDGGGSDDALKPPLEVNHPDSPI